MTPAVAEAIAARARNRSLWRWIQSAALFLRVYCKVSDDTSWYTAVRCSEIKRDNEVIQWHVVVQQDEVIQ